VDLLEKREEFLSAKVLKEETNARQKVSTDKSSALMALKRKKAYEDQIVKLAGTRMSIETQVIALEGAKVSLESMDAMKMGAFSMRTVHRDMNIDKVDDVMDQITEAMDISDEICESLHQPVGSSLDEDELLAELESLEQESLEGSLLNTSVLPTGIVTSSVPAPKGKVATVSKSEEDELRELEASMMTTVGEENNIIDKKKQEEIKKQEAEVKRRMEEEKKREFEERKKKMEMEEMKKKMEKKRQEEKSKQMEEVSKSQKEEAYKQMELEKRLQEEAYKLKREFEEKLMKQLEESQRNVETGMRQQLEDRLRAEQENLKHLVEAEKMKLVELERVSHEQNQLLDYERKQKSDQKASEPRELEREMAKSRAGEESASEDEQQEDQTIPRSFIRTINAVSLSDSVQTTIPPQITTQSQSQSQRQRPQLKPVTTIPKWDQQKVTGMLQPLVKLQQVDGTWKLNSSFAEILGMTVDKLNEEIDKVLTLTLASRDIIFATLIAVVVFEVVYRQRQIEWDLLVKKAKQYLAEKESSDFNVLVSIEKVKQILQRESKTRYYKML